MLQNSLACRNISFISQRSSTSTRQPLSILGRRTSSLLNEEIPNREVSNLIRLGSLWERPKGRPKINQRLHGFQIRLLEQIESSGRQDKVTEA